MPNPTKQWTVMVYLAGDNNLDENGVEDLREMKAVGSTAHLNVLAQFDRAGAGSATRRFLLRKGTSLDADAVAELDETNTGDPNALFDFVKWAVSNHPAERYLLVLWNHGQGWDDTDIYANERGPGARLVRPTRHRHAFFRSTVERLAKLRARPGPQTRAILLDDDAKDFLDNLELKAVGQRIKGLLGRKLDLLGLDACLMNMAEVAYQMRDSALYTAGSEETEPADGWPYDAILTELARQPAMTAEALGKLIVQKYVASYRGRGEAVTQSLCHLGASSALAAAVKKLAAALKAALANPAARAAIAEARRAVQEYYVQDNVDLADLCKLLQAAAVPAAVKSAADQVLAAVQGPGGLVVASGYLGRPMRHSHGAAIYFPEREVSPLYAKLDFAKKTGWGRFLKAWVEAIRARR